MMGRGDIMKKLLTAGAVLIAVGSGGSALAADLPLRAPPRAVTYSWTGCYLGLIAGINGGESKHIYSGLANGVATPLGASGLGAGTDLTGWYRMNGFLGGAEAGCNYQVGAWVLGVEGDWSVTNKDGQSRTLGALVSVGAIAPNAIFYTHERWVATARARIGYLVTDKWLWYLTGGASWIGVDVGGFNVLGPQTVTANQKNNKAGWVAGAGTEYAVGYGWSIKGEFLYAGYDTAHFDGNCAPFSNCTSNDVKLRNWSWRVGMNYKFGWAPAVVANY
jgi:outer membrane immunogenic protein